MVHLAPQTSLLRRRVNPHRSVHKLAQLLLSGGIFVPDQRYDQVPLEGRAFDQHQQDPEEQEEPTHLHHHQKRVRGMERIRSLRVQSQPR